MKNIRFLKKAVFCSLLGLSASFMVSCGSSKNSQNEMMMQMMQMMQQQQQNQQNNAVANQGQQDIAVALDPCIEYAMEEPAKRAYGTGVHFKESTATNLAQLNARANLARALQTCIETATEDYSGGTELFSADDKQGASVTDQTSNTDDREYGIAKELIKGAAIVKMSRYKTPNNQWKIIVCVEYQTSVAEMAAQVAKVYSEKLTSEQKARVKFDEQKFKEQMEKSLSGYKGATMQ